MVTLMSERAGVRVGAAGALLALAMTGCSAHTQAPTENKVPATSTAASPAQGAATPALATPSPPAASIAEAVPIRTVAKIVAEWPQVHAGTLQVVLDVVGQDVLVSENKVKGNASGFRVRSIGSSDGAAEAWKHQGPGAGVIGADMNARTVVWMESASNDFGVAPWTLYARDRGTGQVRRLAGSSRVDGMVPPPVPGRTDPVLLKGWVYWAQVSGRMGAEKVDILGCQVKDCHARRVVKGAALPSAAGGHLYFVTGDRYRGRKHAARYQLRSWEPGSRRTDLLGQLATEPNETPSGLSASGDQVAVTLTSALKGGIALYGLDGRKVVTVDSEPQGMFVTPHAIPGYAAWGDGNASGLSTGGGYVYDFTNRRVLSFGNMPGLNVIHADGALVVWQEGTGPRPDDVTTVIGLLQ